MRMRDKNGKTKEKNRPKAICKLSGDIFLQHLMTGKILFYLNRVIFLDKICKINYINVPLAFVELTSVRK